jgi:DNA-binding NtrC family response regulator
MRREFGPNCPSMSANGISNAETCVDAPLYCEASPPYRILVADDDVTIRQFSARALIRSGYNVDTAEDGAIAWDALRLHSYDLLVTDNNMPKVTGVDLLIKLLAAQMTLPVILISGSFPKEEFTRHPWLQPAATLLKPYVLEEMLRTVKEVLSAADGIREELAAARPGSGPDRGVSSVPASGTHTVRPGLPAETSTSVHGRIGQCGRTP